MNLWSRRRREEKPRLKLDQSLGAFPRSGGDISPLFVFFGIENAGGSDVAVADLWIEPKGGRWISVGDVEGERGLPCVLRPGESSRFWARAKRLARALENEGHVGRPRLTLVVADASGGRHKKRFRFRVDQYLELKDE